MSKSRGGAGRAGRNFATMSNNQVINLAKRSGVTDVGQLSKTQRSALRSAVKKGILFPYPSVWGDRPTYGPPLPKQ